MQTAIFYFDDAGSVDFDKTTALEVIADIAYVNSDFFARGLAVQDGPKGPQLKVLLDSSCMPEFVRLGLQRAEKKCPEQTSRPGMTW